MCWDGSLLNNTDWPGYPLFADNYINNIVALPAEEQNINIFMELSAIGIAQPLSSNILDFLRALPACAKNQGIGFATPSEIFANTNSVGTLDVPDTLSWVDEERDVSCWLGNAFQREAFEKLIVCALLTTHVSIRIGTICRQATTSAL